MSRQHAEVPFRSRQLQLVDLRGEVGDGGLGGEFADMFDVGLAL